MVIIQIEKPSTYDNLCYNRAIKNTSSLKMKQFKKRQEVQVEALQYGVDLEANDMVCLCGFNYKKEVIKYKHDLLGTPRVSFNAVETSSGFVKIQKGDWVVKKDNDLFVVANSVFQLMFEQS